MTSFGVALATTFVLGYAARWIGPRIGAVDRPGPLKPHGRPVSYLGGVAVAAGTLAGLVAASTGPRWSAIAAIAGALLIGLIDDRFGMSALLRLGLQGVLGMVLVAGGLPATAMPGKALAWAGGLLLLAGAMNAVNMVDGMDGLAAGATVISAIGIAVIATRVGHPMPVVLAVALAGAALAFLLHNAPPAGLFLGDNGAYVVGAFLAVAILTTGRSVPGLAGALSCLGLFGLDLMLAVLRRVVGRVPVTTGDRGHLYDQLRARGASDWATLLFCYVLQAAFVLAGILQAGLATAPALLSFTVLWAVVLVALFADGFVRYRA